MLQSQYNNGNKLFSNNKLQSHIELANTYLSGNNQFQFEKGPTFISILINTRRLSNIQRLLGIYLYIYLVNKKKVFFKQQEN